MKTVKSLLLGSAAALVVITGVQAADLPVAEPVEYVKVCSTYGEGFFYIPGTNTCLQISGRVRTDLYVMSNADKDLNDDSTVWDTRGNIAADARSETEWGTLRSYVEFEGTVSDGDNGVEVDQAFAQFAGLTVGYAQSFYDFLEYSFVNDMFSDEKVNQAAYTAAFGSGFSATIAIEDRHDREVGFDILGEDSYGSQTWPNAIAAVRIDQAWGSAQLSGALQQDRVNGIVPGHDSSLAWAAQAGLAINLPFFGTEGSKWWVQGAYTEGALSYAGGTDALANTENDNLDNGGLIGDFTIDADGDVRKTKAWSVGTGFAFQWSPTVVTSLAGFYMDGNQYGGGAFGLPDFKYYQALLNTTWTPVENLDLGVEVFYSKLKLDDGLPNDHVWGAVGRVERHF